MKRPILWTTIFMICGIYMRLGISKVICLVSFLFLLFFLFRRYKHQRNIKRCQLSDCLRIFSFPAPLFCVLTVLPPVFVFLHNTPLCTHPAAACCNGLKHAAPKKSRPAIEAEPFAQRTCHPFSKKHPIYIIASSKLRLQQIFGTNSILYAIFPVYNCEELNLSKECLKIN